MRDWMMDAGKKWQRYVGRDEQGVASADSGEVGNGTRGKSRATQSGGKPPHPKTAKARMLGANAKERSAGRAKSKALS
jgi:hypothetical protein